MTERGTKSQRLQLGWESTFNTAVAATHRLLSLSADFDVQASRRRNYAQGYNFPSSTSMEKDFTEAELEGQPMFDEVIVPLQMALGAVTPVAVGVGGAYSWEWDIPVDGDITPRSATLQRGDNTTGEQVAGCVVTDLSFEWDREEVSMSAALFGTQLTDAIPTAVAGLTAFPQKPMEPNGIGIWLDEAHADLGTTRMLRAFEGGFELSGLFGQIWPLNETKASFDGIVSLQPESESTVMLMADAAGKALLENLRQGDRRYLRWAIKGPVIGAGPETYLFQIDQAIDVVDVDAYDDEEGIYVIPFTFAPMADESWGSAVKVTVVNTQAA